MIEESKMNLPVTECLKFMTLFKRLQIILIFIECLFSAYYVQKVCVRHKVHILKPLASFDGMWRWNLWEVIRIRLGHEG